MDTAKENVFWKWVNEWFHAYGEEQRKGSSAAASREPVGSRRPPPPPGGLFKAGVLRKSVVIGEVTWEGRGREEKPGFQVR